MRYKMGYTLYIVVIIFSFTLSGCAKDNHEDALKKSLRELVSAVEQKEHFVVTNKLSTGFRGNNHFDQRTMSALVFRYYLRHKFIRIYTVIKTIQITDIETANTTAKMTFHAALTSTENALPEHIRVFKIDSHWVQIDEEWKMDKAHWIEVRAQALYPEIKALMSVQKEK